MLPEQYAGSKKVWEILFSCQKLIMLVLNQALYYLFTLFLDLFIHLNFFYTNLPQLKEIMPQLMEIMTKNILIEIKTKGICWNEIS